MIYYDFGKRRSQSPWLLNQNRRYFLNLVDSDFYAVSKVLFWGGELCVNHYFLNSDTEDNEFDAFVEEEWLKNFVYFFVYNVDSYC